MVFKPAQQLRIARGCRREAGSSEHTAEVIEHRGDVNIKVRVDGTPPVTGREIAVIVVNVRPSSQCKGGHGATEVGQDRDGLMQQAPTRSLHRLAVPSVLPPSRRITFKATNCCRPLPGSDRVGEHDH